MSALYRRDFLRSFLMALPASLMWDPERLLWIPGEKKIFIPPAAAYPQVIKVHVVFDFNQLVGTWVHKNVSVRVIGDK